VLWQPEEWQLEYLNKVVNECPGLPIYIFHTYDCDKYGVEREGNNIGASLWDTQSEMSADNELQPVIEHVAHEGESTWIFGYAKHGKTWIWLCVVKSLLTGEPLFNVPDLKVPRKSTRVIYLCPEAGRTSLRKRLKVLNLMGHLYDPITNPEGRLYLRSLSKGAKLKLDDPKLFELAKGADIFIDTAVRYLEGDENSSGDVKVLTENILNLLGTAGARSMWVAHHSGKSFASATEITLENCARGSSEFAAALTNAIGVVQMDKDMLARRQRLRLKRKAKAELKAVLAMAREALGWKPGGPKGGKPSPEHIKALHAGRDRHHQEQREKKALSRSNSNELLT
jgi:hypothetical protein